MFSLRTMSTRHLIACVAMIAATSAGGAAIALAASNGGPVPPPKQLAAAAHDALSAPAPPGITARVRFTNHLISSSTFEGSDPILTGASGRLWLTQGHLRLELQSGRGDAQLVADDKSFWAYDPRSNTVYRGDVPRDLGAHSFAGHLDGVPSVVQVQRFIDRLMRHADVSRAVPGEVAGRPVYELRLSPRRNPGMVGAAALAWDSVRGVPLKVAVFARGGGSPVLELAATDVSYGSVSESAFDVSPPPDAKVVDVRTPPGPEQRHAGAGPPVNGVGAVRHAVPFSLSAPPDLAGVRRSAIRLLGAGGDAAALVAYGHGLDGFVVVEQRAGPRQPEAARSDGEGGSGGLDLGEVLINGISGQELPTALGTVIRFERDGVTFTVAGSVPPGRAEAAARGL